MVEREVASGNQHTRCGGLLLAGRPRRRQIACTGSISYPKRVVRRRNQKVSDPNDANSANAWRSSIQYVESHGELLRAELVEVDQLIEGAIESIVELVISTFGPQPKDATVFFPVCWPAMGALDKAREKLSAFLRPGEEYVRRFHDDGCEIDAKDQDFGGHTGDGECEQRDEEEEKSDESGKSGTNDGESGDDV
jgi:hypothetical protein